MRKIALSSSPHNLVSITGGLAFLHAISRATTSLTLVDIDHDVTNYARHILHALESVHSREDFFSLLTGQTVITHADETLVFCPEQTPKRDVLLRRLQPDTSNFIQQHYNPQTFSVSHKTMNIGDSVVFFTGLSLDQKHFCWHSDWGCFSSSAAFQDMTEALRRCRPQLFTMPLQDFDFSACQGRTLVLASNTDSPLFTKNDPILSAIQEYGRSDLLYVSRTRSYLEDFVPTAGIPRSMPRSILVASDERIAEHTSNHLKTFAKAEWSLMTASEYASHTLYDQDCVAFVFMRSEVASREILIASMLDCCPIHQFIVIVSDCSSNILLRLVTVLSKYQESSRNRIGDLDYIFFELRYRVPY